MVKLKLPPLAVMLVFGSLMYVLAVVLPVGEFHFFGRIWLLYTLLVAAFVIALLALVSGRSGTTVDPSKSGRLVVKGIYGYSRNPIYLAMLLCLLAWGLWLGNVFNTLVAAFFVSYMNRFQIVPEERALARNFGREYQQYCSQVRRWF